MIVRDNKQVAQRVYNGHNIASVFRKVADGMKLVWESVIRRLWNPTKLNNKTYLKN